MKRLSVFVLCLLVSVSSFAERVKVCTPNGCGTVEVVRDANGVPHAVKGSFRPL